MQGLCLPTIVNTAVWISLRYLKNKKLWGFQIQDSYMDSMAQYWFDYPGQLHGLYDSVLVWLSRTVTWTVWLSTGLINQDSYMDNMTQYWFDYPGQLQGQYGSVLVWLSRTVTWTVWLSTGLIIQDSYMDSMTQYWFDYPGTMLGKVTAIL